MRWMQRGAVLLWLGAAATGAWAQEVRSGTLKTVQGPVQVTKGEVQRAAVPGGGCEHAASSTDAKARQDARWGRRCGVAWRIGTIIP